MYIWQKSACPIIASSNPDDVTAIHGRESKRAKLTGEGGVACSLSPVNRSDTNHVSSCIQK